MKKQIIILFASLSVLADCNQEPQRPSADKLTQKVQDKYGADLTAIKDLKKMQWYEAMSQQVSERLAGADPATPVEQQKSISKQSNDFQPKRLFVFSYVYFLKKFS